MANSRAPSSPGFSVASDRGIASGPSASSVTTPDLSVSPGFWSSIEQAIDESEFFILLASPEAAASERVQREVEHWVQRKSVGRLLIALTGGEVAWDASTRDFDWEKTTALPPVLGWAFDEEPPYLDFRSARTTKNLSLMNPDLRTRIADLAATLHARPTEERIGLDVRQHRGTNRVVWGAGFALLALALLATGLWRSAESRREQAERLQQIATARRLATEAGLARNQEPVLHQRSLLLGVEAMRRLATLGQPAVQADQAVRGPLATSPRPLATIPTNAPVARLVLGPGGQIVATGDMSGMVRLYDATTGAERWRAEHADRVTVLGWSADGRSLLSASADGTARIWDPATGRELVRVRHDKPVLGAALSPDGRRLATGSLDSTARMWDVTTGRELGHVFAEPGVRALAWSADGRWLGLSGADETVRLVEAAVGRPVGRIPRGSATLDAVALSPDGQRIATRAGAVTQLWELATQRLVARIREEPDGQEQAGTGMPGAEWRDDAIAFSRDGRWLAAAHRDRTVRILDAQNGSELVRIRYGDVVWGLAWSPDGRWLATRSGQGVRVVEAATGGDAARIEGDGPVWAIAFGDEARRLAVGSGATVRVWQLDMRREATAFADVSGTWQEVWSPDGRWVTTQCDPRTVCVWETAAATIAARLSHPAPLSATPRAVVWSPDGGWLATTGQDHMVRLWNAATGSEAARLPHPLLPDDIVFTGDGKQLATRSGAPGREPGEVRFWDIATGQEAGRFAPPEGVAELALSSDGKGLATVGGDHVLRLWDVMRFRETRTVPDVDAVVLSRDGARVIAWRNQTARILEMASGRETGRVTHDGRIDAAVLTADGKWLITAGQDRTARISDARTGKEKVRLGHELPIGALALSADGRWLATGSGHPITGRGEARVWELATGLEVARIPHERGVSVVAFSPDGHWVATRSREWPTRLWLWRPPDMMAEACVRLTRNLTRDEWRELVGEASYQPTCPNLPAPPQEVR